MLEIKLTGFADEIDYRLDEQIRVLRELGMTWVEMRGVDGKGLVNHSINEAQEIKKKLDANGIALSAIGSPIGKIKITDDFAPHFELFKHTAALAHVMGTPNIRMFSFYMPGEITREMHDEVLERMDRFVEYASANGVVLLHENEKGIYGEKAGECLELMERFYGEHFKAVFDFANFIQAHQDTPEAYRMLKPYIAYVHIKDAMWTDGSVVPAGYGDGHVREILKALYEEGFQGFLSLEPHLSDFRGFAQLEENGRLDKRMTGEEAFRLAHKSLMHILQEMETAFGDDGAD